MYPISVSTHVPGLHRTTEEGKESQAWRLQVLIPSIYLLLTRYLIPFIQQATATPLRPSSTVSAVANY